ncbi:MAG: FKBP-type peptidyl-prolyl cis-trans isomerase [Actinomycetales bacterium]|nr:FKBP-type peptidyl-prolyl cis-trans isomerase [Actinomycetales bacterium]
MPTATGEFGDKPELTFPSETHLAEGALHVLSEGDGDVVEAGDLLLANYLGQVWGGEVFDNSYDRGEPSAFPIGTGYVVTGWDQGLVGLKLGTRVLLSLPPDLGYGASGNPNAGIGGEDTIVFVVDLVDSFGADSAAQADATPGEALPADGPQVEGALGSAATLTIPEGATEPTAQSSVVLGTGTGTAVADGDNVVVHYAIASFDEAEGYSTWDNGTPEQLIVGAGSPLEELVGVPAGSRVFINVPATESQAAWVAVMDIVAVL